MPFRRHPRLFLVEGLERPQDSCAQQFTRAALSMLVAGLVGEGKYSQPCTFLQRALHLFAYTGARHCVKVEEGDVLLVWQHLRRTLLALPVNLQPQARTHLLSNR